MFLYFFTVPLKNTNINTNTLGYLHTTYQLQQSHETINSTLNCIKKYTCKIHICDTNALGNIKVIISKIMYYLKMLLRDGKYMQTS